MNNIHLKCEVLTQFLSNHLLPLASAPHPTPLMISVLQHCVVSDELVGEVLIGQTCVLNYYVQVLTT